SIATASRWWTRPSCCSGRSRTGSWLPPAPPANGSAAGPADTPPTPTAPPGTREYGVLSVLVRHGADVKRLLSLPPGAFRPAPNVYSAVVRLQFHPDEPPARDELVFEKLTQAIFTRRRKTLTNALLAYPPSSGVQVSEVL